MQRSWVAQSSGSPSLSLVESNVCRDPGLPSHQDPYLSLSLVESKVCKDPGLPSHQDPPLSHWWSPKYAETLGCPVIRIPLSLTGGVQSMQRPWVAQSSGFPSLSLESFCKHTDLGSLPDPDLATRTMSLLRVFTRSGLGL